MSTTPSVGLPAVSPSRWRSLAMFLAKLIIASSLPISPGGLGVGEAAGSQLFAEFGLSNGGLIVLIVRLGVIAFSIPGAIIIFGSPKPKATLAQQGGRV